MTWLRVALPKADEKRRALLVRGECHVAHECHEIPSRTFCCCYRCFAAR